MVISSTDFGLSNQQQAASKSESATSAANLNFDMFLRLLTTQLQNQDPLNPLDGTQFTEQIASFSGLEQQIQTNKLLEDMSTQRALTQQALAVGMIGNEVLAPADKVELVNGDAPFSYVLKDQAVSTIIELYDEEGVLVHSIDGETEAGMHVANWDGKTIAGEDAPNGKYLMKISAYDSEGNKVESATLAFTRVAGVESHGTDQTYLILDNGVTVQFDEVFSVRKPPVAAENNDSSDNG